MEMSTQLVTDGVNLFINIVVFLVAFAIALSFLDFRKENQKESK